MSNSKSAERTPTASKAQNRCTLHSRPDDRVLLRSASRCSGFATDAWTVRQGTLRTQLRTAARRLMTSCSRDSSQRIQVGVKVAATAPRSKLLMEYEQSPVSLAVSQETQFHFSSISQSIA
jgi:hypothetical protein